MLYKGYLIKLEKSTGFKKILPYYTIHESNKGNWKQIGQAMSLPSAQKKIDTQTFGDIYNLKSHILDIKK
jgi:hypothetical protein